MRRNRLPAPAHRPAIPGTTRPLALRPVSQSLPTLICASQVSSIGGPHTKQAASAGAVPRLVSCLVLADDVGADPAAVGNLQPGCPGPGPDRATIDNCARPPAGSTPAPSTS